MPKTNIISKIIYGFFMFFVLFTFVFFIFSKVSGNADYSFDDKSIYDWSLGWEYGPGIVTEGKVNLPAKLDVDEGRPIVLKKTLPDTIKKYNCLMLESKRQDIMVHVGGILRTSYTDKETRIVGDSSPSAIVIVPLYNTDAGQDIKVTITSNTKYSGDISRIYFGNEMSIMLVLIKNNLFWAALVVIMMILGLVCFVGYFIYKGNYDDSKILIYLFWFAVLSAAWSGTQLNIRQVFVDDIAMFENMGYCCLMLLPISVVLYFDWMCEGSYRKICLLFEAVLIVNFVVENFLQANSWYSFFELTYVMELIYFFILISMLIMSYVDIKKHTRTKVQYMFLGIGSLGAGLLAEMINYYMGHESSRGTHYSMGAIVYLAVNGLYTAVTISKQQQLRKDAVNANIAKSSFLATMSHEIRTPINAVLGMNEMILRDSKESIIRGYAANIAEAGKSLLSLVNDILDFSKIESGKMNILCVEYSMKSLLRDLILMIEGRVNDKELELIIDIDENIPAKYFGDEVRIKQVVTNMLTNAAKYTSEGSITFTVKCHEIQDDEALLYFSVKDTGIGIKSEDIEKLMDPFVRVDEGRNRNIEGTGLGLSITRQLLNLMDSNLELDTEYGKGSDFHFEIKQKIIDTAVMGPIDVRDDEDVKRKGLTFTAPMFRILAVDDNPMNLTVVRGLLKPTQIMVDTCESGAECLRLCEYGFYHMILMDHMMPDMDGIETLRRLRETTTSPCWSSTVIALTANAVSGAAEMYREKGFDGYITKPIDIGELDECLRNFIPNNMLMPLDESAGAVTDLSEELPLTTELIDGKVAMDYSGGDYGSYIEILKSYYKYGVKSLKASNEAGGRLFGDVSIEDFTVKVHSLKSSSKTIGAMGLSELAKSLEDAGHNGDMDYINNNSNDCMSLYQRVIDQVSEYLKEKGLVASSEETAKAPTGSVNDADMDSVLESLKEARDALDDFDYDVAMDIIDKIIEKNMA